MPTISFVYNEPESTAMSQRRVQYNHNHYHEFDTDLRSSIRGVIALALGFAILVALASCSGGVPNDAVGQVMQSTNGTADPTFFTQEKYGFDSQWHAAPTDNTCLRFTWIS